MAVLALHSRNAPLAFEDCFDFFHRGLRNGPGGLLDGLHNMLLHREAAMCERTRTEPSTTAVSSAAILAFARRSPEVSICATVRPQGLE